MRILFLGSGAFGLPTLKALAASHELVGVVSQPDRPAGRGKTLTPTPIAGHAQAELTSLPLWKPDNINDPAVIAELHALNADAWVVIAFGQKLGQTLLGDRFVINLHASILPRWRGAAPINHAMLAGDLETGNSVITLAERMDAGFVLAQNRTPIRDNETAGELHDRLSEMGPEVIQAVLEDHAGNAVTKVEQDESKVTYARKLSKADAVIDLSQPAIKLLRRIHGLNPWPGINASLEGTALKIHRVTLGPPADTNEHPAPGTLIDPADGMVACGQGSVLQLLEVQPAGKRAMSWRDFAAGRPLKAGDMLTSESTKTTSP